jgi:hypothetical protein
VSGRLTVTVATKISGPIAEGKAPEILQRYAEDVTQAVADRGAELLRAFPMDKTGRATGAFQRELHPVRRNRDTVVISGPVQRGVVWAPWLEGTTRRNESTHFGGYHLFRKTRLQLDREAARIAADRLQPYIEELGGE